MEGKITYVITYVAGAGNMGTVTMTDPEDMWKTFMSKKKWDPEFKILDARRVVAEASGTVKFTEVGIGYNDNGLEIHDQYDNILDRYVEPEPGKKRYKVVRSETWTNEIEVEAESEDDAIKIVDKLVADGGFDVLDGWCTDVDHEVYDA